MPFYADSNLVHIGDIVSVPNAFGTEERVVERIDGLQEVYFTGGVKIKAIDERGILSGPAHREAGRGEVMKKQQNPDPGKLVWYLVSYAPDRILHGIVKCVVCNRINKLVAETAPGLRSQARDDDWSLGRDKNWRCPGCRPRRFGEKLNNNEGYDGPRGCEKYDRGLRQPSPGQDFEFFDKSS